MADNIQLGAAVGSGDTVDADDIGGVKIPGGKIKLGANNTDDGYVCTANPLPVNDAGGTLSIDDGAGSITVDGTVAATQSGTWNVGTVTTITNVVHIDDNSSTISIDDGAGSITVDGTVAVSGTVTIAGAVTNAGTFVVQENGAALTALQLIDNIVVVEDAAHASGDSGVMSLAVRRDANTTLVGTDGDYAPLQVDSSGSLKVAITAGAGSGGTSIADDAAFTVASTSLTPVGGTYRSVRDSVDDNDAGCFAMSQKRALYTVIETPLGDSAMDDTNDAVRVNIVAGSSSGTQYAEDAAHVSGDTGTMALGVRKDTAVALGGTDGDYQPMIFDSTGKLHVNVGNTVTVGSHAVTNAGTFAVQVDGAALTALQLIDDPVIADDAAFTPATSKVMMAGFEADETATDSVDEGDAGAARMTLDRKQIVTDYAHTAGGTSSYTALSTAAVLTAQVKGSAGQVYGVEIFNKGAAAVYARLYDQTGAPASTDTANIVWRGIVPGNTAGAGFICKFPKGKTFATGIGIRVSGAIADNDTTVLAANEVTANVDYK